MNYPTPKMLTNIKGILERMERDYKECLTVNLIKDIAESYNLNSNLYGLLLDYKIIQNFSSGRISFIRSPSTLTLDEVANIFEVKEFKSNVSKKKLEQECIDYLKKLEYKISKKVTIYKEV